MEKQSQSSREQQPQQVDKKPSRRKRTFMHKFLFFSFKWTFILFCLMISIVAGLVFGFSIIGDGEVSEVFDLRMWKHLYDLVFSI